MWVTCVVLPVCVPLKRISHVRNTKIWQCNESFTNLVCFQVKIMNNFPFVQFVIDIQWRKCSQFLKMHLLDPFYHRSEVQISNSLLIHGNLWQEMTSHSALPSVSTCAFHKAWHYMSRAIYSMNKDGCNEVHCDCFPSISIILSTLCAKFIYCVCWLRIFHVCRIHPIELLIIIHYQHGYYTKHWHKT